MTPRQKLLHAPHLLRTYDEAMAARRAYDRAAAVYAFVTIATLLAFAALPFILYWGDLLP